MKVLVLAGGKATRLRDLSKETPKYLMPVGDKTFADFHMVWLRSQGFREIILSIGHLGEQIKTHCGHGEQWGLSISYLEDGPELLGTGGAVHKALQFEFESLAVTYGDTLLNFNVQDFLKKFERSKLDAAMTVYRNQVPGHQCNISYDGKTLLYDKVNPESNWTHIDYGFLALKRKLIEQFPKTRPLDLAEPLSAASKQSRVLGFEVKDRFWEIGSPEALHDFQMRYKVRI